MQKIIPVAKDAYMKAVSVSTYKKQLNKVTEAINKAIYNGELCCEVFLNSIMDKELHDMLERKGYSIYSIERADSSRPSIYTISWATGEFERNK